VTTTDYYFIQWIDQIYNAWEKNNSFITSDHEVSQYIKGYKILSNTPWDKVDFVCIPDNVSLKFHWIMVVFYINNRCLYLTKKLVEQVLKNTSHIIPLFLMSTEFDKKRNDIDWKNSEEYVDYALTDPLA
ncbi:hypothetical protein H5410_036753, partial [Solanum commersonii]